MYRYFISYVFRNDGGPGFGSCEVHRPEPIRDADGVNEIAAEIRTQRNAAWAVVLTFQRFEG